MNEHLRQSIRVAQRGVTLVEMLIVVAIMAMVATAVAVAAVGYWKGARLKSTATSAMTIREGVRAWWVTHDDGTCPSVPELVSTGVLDEGSPRSDLWGHPWRVECAGTAVTVTSDGPDGLRGSPDDIRVPPKTI